MDPGERRRIPVTADERTRIAIVTGAGSGIGEATTRALVDRGDRVLMVGRGAGRLRAVQASVGADSAEILAVDLTADGAPEQIVHAALGRWGRLDVVVNNAGTYRHGTIAEQSMTDFDETFAVNVRGPYALTRAAVPAMSAGSGSIVFVGSNLTRYGKPGAASYAASKAAVESLARTLAVELGPAGIRVNAVSPGVTRTAMTEANFVDDVRRRQLLSTSPVGHLGAPEDIAGTIAFLTSAAARYINGSTVVVDGGRRLL
jgi:NAD(P)-dependent dehydrogenase (short-subunit alcohol dehydrogenase family)